MKIGEKTGTVARSLFVKGNERALLINSAGTTISFPISTIRITGRAASGVRLMRMPAGTEVIDARALTEDASENDVQNDKTA